MTHPHFSSSLPLPPCLPFPRLSQSLLFGVTLMWWLVGLETWLAAPLPLVACLPLYSLVSASTHQAMQVYSSLSPCPSILQLDCLSYDRKFHSYTFASQTLHSSFSQDVQTTSNYYCSLHFIRMKVAD